jgi:hypothetical protein
LAIAHIAASYPSLLPLLAQQSVYGQAPYGIHPLLQATLGQVGSPFQQFGAGVGAGFATPISPILSLLGQQGYGQQFTTFGPQVSPLSTILSLAAQQRGITAPQVGPDPYTLALHLSQLSQSQLPIRPLVSPQQFDPVQAACLTSAISGQPVDPYTALAQSCLPSPAAISPIYSAVRPYTVSPWAVAPVAPLASLVTPQVIPSVIPQIVPQITPMMQGAAPVCI